LQLYLFILSRTGVIAFNNTQENLHKSKLALYSLQKLQFLFLEVVVPRLVVLHLDKAIGAKISQNDRAVVEKSDFFVLIVNEKVTISN